MRAMCGVQLNDKIYALNSHVGLERINGTDVYDYGSVHWHRHDLRKMSKVEVKEMIG